MTVETWMDEKGSIMAPKRCQGFPPPPPNEPRWINEHEMASARDEQKWCLWLHHLPCEKRNKRSELVWNHDWFILETHHVLFTENRFLTTPKTYAPLVRLAHSHSVMHKQVAHFLWLQQISKQYERGVATLTLLCPGHSWKRRGVDVSETRRPRALLTSIVLFPFFWT